MLKKELAIYEKKATNYNIPFIFIMAMSGLAFGSLANSSAILLDGYFSFVLFLTIFLGKFIQHHTAKPKNVDYPMGKSSLENLYVLFKILILIGLLLVSLFDACKVFYEYANGTYIEQEVIQSYANIYYVVKLSAFAVSMLIYTYFIKKVRNKSEVLRIDRKGTLLDGIITLSIMVGLYVLGFIPILAPIADSIVLFFLAAYLLYEMIVELSHSIASSLGKRSYVKEENYYKAFFNNYFSRVTICDIYINKTGDAYFGFVALTYEGAATCEELVKFEKIIKNEMNKKFDEIYIELYIEKYEVDKKWY